VSLVEVQAGGVQAAVREVRRRGRLAARCCAEPGNFYTFFRRDAPRVVKRYGRVLVESPH
jgi:hypothetical protein